MARMELQAHQDAACHALQLSPALALLTVMLWCHTPYCVIVSEKDCS